MRVTTSPLVYQGRHDTHELTWHELVAWLQSSAPVVVNRKQDVTLFSLTEVEGGVGAANVRSIHGICLDYDGTTALECQQALNAAKGLAGGACYTSYRHGVHVDEGRPDATHRFRILFPFDRPMRLEDFGTAHAMVKAWLGVWEHVANAVGRFHPTKAPGTAERNVDRRWYIPATNPALLEAGGSTYFEAWDGEPLPLDVLLGQPAPPVQELEVVDELDQSEIIGPTELHAVATKLIRAKSEEHQTLGRSLQKALLGEPFAQEGARNTTAYKLAGEIARAYPHADARHVAQLFAPSFDACGSLQDGRDNQTVFAEQLQRQQRVKLHQAAEQKQLHALFAGVAPPAAMAPRDEAVTPQALEPAGPPVYTPGALILQRQGEFWLRQPTSPHFEKQLARADLDTGLSNFYATGVMQRYTADGKKVPVQTLLDTYSWVLDGKCASYSATANSYDPRSNSIVLATAPRVAHEPRFSETVDAWLKLVGGPRKAELEGWLRGLFHLDMPSPALYLWGKTGAGKSMLIAGLSRLWHHGHARLEDMMAGFNEQLVGTPLVVCDEAMPRKFTLAEARRITTQTERSINIKMVRPFTLNGCIRLLLAGNNPRLLSHDTGNLTSEDAEAAANRFLSLHVGEDVAAFVRGLPRERINAMVEHELAEHVTWLYAQKPERPSLRFVVDTNDRELAMQIAGERYTEEAAWLLRYLESPRTTIEALHCSGSPDSWKMRIKDGKLYAVESVFDYANGALRSRDRWRAAFQYFSSGRKKLRVPKLGKQRDYREIDVEKLMAALGEYDMSAIVETLAEDTETRMGLETEQ